MWARSVAPFVPSRKRFILKISPSSLGFPTKESSTKPAAPSLPSATVMQFAHYLGLPSVSEKAKSLSTKVSGAASRVLNRKPASVPVPVPVPHASRNELFGPAIFATPENSGAATSSASNVKQAIAAERARAAEILVAGINAGCVNQACALAFDSDLTAAQAIVAISAGTLDTAAQTGNGLRRRMGLDPDQPAGGTANRAPTAEETAARIVAAGERARTGDTSRSASPTTSSASRIVAAGERARGQ